MHLKTLFLFWAIGTLITMGLLKMIMNESAPAVVWPLLLITAPVTWPLVWFILIIAWYENWRYTKKDREIR